MFYDISDWMWKIKINISYVGLFDKWSDDIAFGIFTDDSKIVKNALNFFIVLDLLFYFFDRIFSNMFLQVNVVSWIGFQICNETCFIHREGNLGQVSTCFGEYFIKWVSFFIWIMRVHFISVKIKSFFHFFIVKVFINLLKLFCSLLTIPSQMIKNIALDSENTFRC